ncbi:MAG: oxamate carbamoyltransferase subunit AllH family protein [Alphaproteobacteria bacterium]
MTMPDGAVTGAVRGAIAVPEIGPDAARALAGVGTGRVAAVFARSIYLRTSRGWACAGPPGLGSGPLNLLCDLPVTMDWAARGLRPGAEIGIGEKTIDLGRGLVLALDGARVWRPAPSGPWSRESLGEGLRALDRLTAAVLPTAGLASFLRSGGTAASAEARMAAPNVAILHAWLQSAPGSNTSPPHSVLKAAMGLLGLGPGLTPSGDDYLGGLLIALRLLNRGALAARLWTGLEAAAARRSVELSVAHLRAAAAGRGSAALHAALNVLVAGRTGHLPAVLKRIEAIGHTSGWDALAGAVTALRAFTEGPVDRGQAAGIQENAGQTSRR